MLPADGRTRAAEVQIHAFSMPDFDPAARARLDRIERAIEERRRLALAYADEAGRAPGRTVRPLCLVYWGKVWTLIAWCELRQDFRMFRVDRIARAEADGGFRPEKGRTLEDFYAREVPCEFRP